MALVETVSLLFLLLFGIICSFSDIKTGLIPNWIICCFLISAIVMDLIYYGIFVTDIAGEFLLNFIIVGTVALFLFYTYSFAGGDSKMLIVMAALYPAREYLVLSGTNITLFLAPAAAILLGYFYFFCLSLKDVFSDPGGINMRFFCTEFGKGIISYLSIFSLILLLQLILPQTVLLLLNKMRWPWLLLSFLAGYITQRISLSKKSYLLAVTAAADLTLCLLLRINPIVMPLYNYFFIFLILLIRIIMTKNLYKTVEISQLKEGMILSSYSSVLFQTSITKGLPPISSETLKDRLSPSQIEAIKKWSRAVRINELTIVKKIPFGLFISLGFLIYWIIGRLCR